MHIKYIKNHAVKHTLIRARVYWKAAFCPNWCLAHFLKKMSSFSHQNAHNLLLTAVQYFKTDLYHLFIKSY